MEQSKINWKQILATAVVTGTVTVGTGMLLFTLQTKEPRLIYTLTDAIPFRGGKENIAIYNVEVKNEGKRAVKDVICRIDTASAHIREYRFTGDPSLVHNEKTVGSVLTSKISSLSPQEEIRLSILASTPLNLPLRPKVGLRGEGLLGHEANPGRGTLDKGLSLGASILAALAGVAAAGVMSSAMKKMFGLKDSEDDERHGDDQSHVLAYLLGVRGEVDKADEYLQRRKDTTTYWSEADRITSRALVDSDKRSVDVAQRLLDDLLIYARISKASEGIVHYNLARLAKFKGDEASAREQLGKAESRIPNLLKARLGIDPLFAGAKRTETQETLEPKR